MEPSQEHPHLGKEHEENEVLVASRQLSGPMVWSATDLTPSKYIHQLSQGEVAEIESAIRTVKDTSLALSEISPSTFPLTSPLRKRLNALSEEIHDGTGVVVIRGLSAASYDDEESIIAFVGVTCHVCPERATSAANSGLTLTHIRDATKEPVPESRKGTLLAGSKIPDALKFHTDRLAGDVVALYLRNLGSGGGEQYLSSFWSICKQLAEEEPAVLNELTQNVWPWMEKDKQTDKFFIKPGQAVWVADGKPIIQTTYAPLFGNSQGARPNYLPRVSAGQRHALDVLESKAISSSIKLDRQEGDIQLVNNFSVLHARSAYESTAKDVAAKRHLLRLFLRDPDQAWKRPKDWEDSFNDPFVGEKQFLPLTDFDPWLITTSGSNCDHG